VGTGAFRHPRPQARVARRRGPLSRDARRAGLDDVDTVARLLAAAGARLAADGFRNWDPPYPADRVRHDVEAREVWVVIEDDVPVATYTLARAPSRPYEPPPWPDPGMEGLYLNRLAVDPARQGSGVGGWCLAEVDARAAALDVRAVRCDVLRENAALRQFYERRGYVAHGERAHSGWTFVCYEKRL
jgi:GNAT superfamily N-acetyltransferase